MLLGMATKLSVPRLAITGNKYTWNHSLKSSGTNALYLGAMAVSVRFRMMSRTAGSLMKVMFSWKETGFAFQFKRTL